MDKAAETRRRPFRFSLRLLLAAVTAICLWLGWGLYQVRQRERVHQFLLDRGAGVGEAGVEVKPWRRVPLTWRLLGVEPVAWIIVDGEGLSDEDREEIRSWFPEADVTFN
jgi:hypothetical protein